MKKHITFIIWLLCSHIVIGAGKSYILKSPDGKLEVAVTVDKQITYSLTHEGQLLLDKSAIALVLADGKESVLGNNARVKGNKTRSITEEIVSPNYRVRSFTTCFNEINLNFDGNFGLVFRVYNEGVAYRFNTNFKNTVEIKDEVAEFNFDKDYTTYMAYSTSSSEKDLYAMAFQNLYTKATLTNANTESMAFLPVTVDYANGKKLTITESDLEAYPGMFVKGDGKKTALKGVFAAYPSRMDYRPWRRMSYVAERSNVIAKTEGKRSYPWRILAVSENDVDMPVNNLVYALASPNRIGDYSWVKSGKVAWDWWNNWGIYGVDFKAGINMDTYKYYIDFASEKGIPFIILDEGWYNPKAGDMLTVIPELNLPELVRYGKSKKVDIILWTVFNVLDDQLEEACKKYSEMGISGFKVDFLDRDDQTGVEMVYRIAETTAKYKLSLDLHGIYKPTGLNRTYPNIINFESVFGMEEVKWSTAEKDMMQYDVTMPYIRMMAGPIDYTPGAMRNASKKNFKPIYNNPMSQGTRCHQLATYIVHDSPLTMLADNPSIYKNESECTDFITSIPNTGIEKTVVLQGTLGEYIVTARCVGSDWYIGGMTNWDARTITLDFSFLDNGEYAAVLFKDGVNADEQAFDYKKEVMKITAQSKLTVRMASGGGFAISLRKI